MSDKKLDEGISGLLIKAPDENAATSQTTGQFLDKQDRGSEAVITAVDQMILEQNHEKPRISVEKITIKTEVVDPTPSVVASNTLASPTPNRSQQRPGEDELSEVLSSQLQSNALERSSMHMSRELVQMPVDLF